MAKAREEQKKHPMQDNLSWKNYFRDTTHSRLGISKLYCRWLSGKDRPVTDKEFYIQKFLTPTQLVSKPYIKIYPPLRFLPCMIIEERLTFNDLNQKKDDFICDVGVSLRHIHDYARENRRLILKHIPKNKLLREGSYSPLTILETFIVNPFQWFVNSKSVYVNLTVTKTIAEIKKRVVKLSSRIKYRPEYCSLIHGDLNQTNVVRTSDGRIKFLDWASCRWDIVTCDISQFIYLHSLNHREKKLFLGSYEASWITENMLEIHRLLLIGWDIIYLMTTGLKIEPDKQYRLEPLKRKLWGKCEIPIANIL